MNDRAGEGGARPRNRGVGAGKPRTLQRAATPFAQLDPSRVLDAVAESGYVVDGRLLAMNSFENRVYRVGIEGAAGAAPTTLIAKFYRPARWTDAQILEEHRFCAELQQEDIPAVAPLAAADGGTLREHDGFRFALFPNRPGRAPDLERPGTLPWLGRYLARIHTVGARTAFACRERIDPRGRIEQAIADLSRSPLLPREQAPAWLRAAELVLQATPDMAAANLRPLRLHGDVHAGNVLWNEPARDDGPGPALRHQGFHDGPHFVDFDDAVTGPAVQDLWMLLSGDRAAMQRQLAALLQGYSQLREFDARELQWVEALRSLRLIGHSAWLAQRWHDPSFPHAFPWYGTASYWQQQTQFLLEQVEALQEPPLAP
jgi:Ser/Thr protein kinase RdoA (MazF antagonist)